MTLNKEKIDKETEDEYDFADNCEEIAKERGQIVVLPEEGELQIDVDSKEQMEEMRLRIATMLANFCEYVMFTVPSRSGGDKCHVYIKIDALKIESDWHRIAMQAALGDDPTRVLLNTTRAFSGVENPSRLFEMPDFVRKYPKFWSEMTHQELNSHLAQI